MSNPTCLREGAAAYILVLKPFWRVKNNKYTHYKLTNFFHFSLHKYKWATKNHSQKNVAQKKENNKNSKKGHEETESGGREREIYF